MLFYVFVVLLVDSQLNAKIADLELGVSKSAVKGFYRKRRGGAFASGRNPHTNGGFLSCLSCTCPHRDAEADDVGRSSVFSDIRESISNALSMIEPIEEAEHILANWASPEFISDGTYTQASDVYALGLVMWEIASKQLPFDDISDQELLRQMVCATHVLHVVFDYVYIVNMLCRLWTVYAPQSHLNVIPNLLY